MNPRGLSSCTGAGLIAAGPRGRWRGTKKLSSAQVRLGGACIAECEHLGEDRAVLYDETGTDLQGQPVAAADAPPTCHVCRTGGGGRHHVSVRDVDCVIQVPCVDSGPIEHAEHVHLA